MDVRRSNVVLRPNHARVLFRPFRFHGEQRPLKIVARLMALSERQVAELLSDVLRDFKGRHQKPQEYFLRRFEEVRQFLLTDDEVTEKRKTLIGAYFSQEYSLESAALFNPSMVWHPSQKGVAPGAKRFIVSLRSTGEGHVSSISFRTGLIDSDGKITIDVPTRFVTAPPAEPNASYDKPLFVRKLFELGLANEFVDLVMGQLDDAFTLQDLQLAVGRMKRQHRARLKESEQAAEGMLALAQSNYQVRFAKSQGLSERVIFPYAPTETNGIEDARFVEFHDDDGRRVYYATYSAFDGRVVLPQLLETEDFLLFRMSTLNGPEVRNKGFALFPRKINGHYAMLSRQDGENMFVMYSDMVHFWYSKQLVLKPTSPWEFVQVGNCGPPIETSAGWLVLTHGVGPMRKYAIGACLLDLNDPCRVIGRLREPLLTPNENEREGYVPNVVYSCGGLVFGDTLVIPYAMADFATTFATVSLPDLLTALTQKSAAR
jgi:predicted GH43/DUF377 family glycosyl hydrolase